MSRGHRLVVATLFAACVVGSLTAAHAQQEDPPPSPPSPAPEAAVAPAPEAAPALEATPAAAPAAPVPATSSLEVWAGIGPSIMFGEPANPQYESSFRRAGAYAELGIAYRSNYFIDPFLSVGYATLAAGDADLPDGPWGEGGKLDQHLGGWFLSPGITGDIWRFRLRFGIGLAILSQSFSYRGEDTSSSMFPLMTQAGVGFNAVDAGRFRLDAEVRFVTAPGADLNFMSLNVIARGDLVVFGGATPNQYGSR